MQEVKPFSFRQVYAYELSKLRPARTCDQAGIWNGVDPRAKEGGEGSDSNRDALVELFRSVHTGLADKESRECRPLAAICLSGGGIRSATFNLGVLQGLARLGLLTRFDYLSSVSGGGYIAGWLKAWMYRAGTDHVVDELAQSCVATPADAASAPRPHQAGNRDPLAPETKPIDRLREFSNYLTPKVGLVSPDTWTAVALVVRNLLLNWLVLMPVLAATVAIPQLAFLMVQTQPGRWLELAVVVVAVFLASVASFFVHSLRQPDIAEQRATQGMIIRRVVVPIYLAATLLSLAVAWAPWEGRSVAARLPGWVIGGGELSAKAGWLWDAALFVGLWTVMIPLVGWLLADGLRRRGPDHARTRRAEAFGLVISGLISGALLVWVAYYAVCGSACGHSAYLRERPMLLVILAAPAVLADYLVARALFVAIASVGEKYPDESRAPVGGLRGRHRPEESGTTRGTPKVDAGRAEAHEANADSADAHRGLGDKAQRAENASTQADATVVSVLDDFDREWWGRLSGWVLAPAVGWLLFSAVCLAGGSLLQQIVGRYAEEILAAVGGVAGILTAVLARSSTTASGRGTNTKPTSARKDVALKIAAPLFVVALATALSYGTAALGQKVTGDPTLLRDVSDTRVAAADARQQVGMSVLLAPGADRPYPVPWSTIWLFGAVPAALLAVAGLASRIVNVNRFSLHGLYRNRLVRAYLGASNANRKCDPFTGFATDDNLPLSTLWREKASTTHPGVSTRPLPVVNAALNLVTGTKRLAWQLRKAESFSMTPFFCGNFHEGYRPTHAYGGRDGVTLGTAMTISGAAANPSMGYHSSALVTFLMTLFNARLGAWLGNTNSCGKDTFYRAGPKSALRPLLAELAGRTDSDHPYVNLSDGGHFDNLGLYEMVLRRCRYILVSDAGRDPSAGFEDLGNAIRKIRIDFGIPIEFKEKIPIFPREENEEGVYCAIADVHYCEIDGPGVPTGRIVYIKPAIFDRRRTVPYDVFAYHKASQDFPHESTSDQWFDEAQFESYRALGHHIVRQISVHAPNVDDFPAFEKAVGRYIRAEKAAAAEEDGKDGKGPEPGATPVE